MGEPALREERPPADAAPPRPPRPAGPPPARVGRRVVLARRLITEIEALQPLLHELVQQYEMRMTAQLAEIHRVLNGDAGRLPRFPPAKTSAAMLRALRAADVKPRKGRAKDMVRLHELVAELTEMLPPRE